MLSGPSDDVIQVDELYAICIHMVLELCSRDTQLDHTLSSGKSCIRLALCHDIKAADYAQNYICWHYILKSTCNVLLWFSLLYIRLVARFCLLVHGPFSLH